MAYTRFGDTDSYMLCYGNVGYACLACRLIPNKSHFKDFIAGENPEELLIHMYDHLHAGFPVQEAIERLTNEIEDK